MTATHLERRLRSIVSDGLLDLPAPGNGATVERLRTLVQVARTDLPLARLAEAHTDATAILAEAGMMAEPGVLYGVWASEDPAFRLRAASTERGSITLTGAKPFCTGASIVDHALVTVRDDDGASVLFDVDLRHCADSITFDRSGWVADAFMETRTAVAHFDRAEVADQVGESGWYLDRVGFWQGACAPPACWAGGALGLVDAALLAAAASRSNPHLDAQVGDMVSVAWRLDALVDHAARCLDSRAAEAGDARDQALAFRHGVERAAGEIIDLFGRALGPRPLVSDAAVIKRIAELQLYVRQHHGERDLAVLGRSHLDRSNRRVRSNRDDERCDPG